MLYFAYGSNLDPEQMQRRCPSAVLVARATIGDHRLVFGGWSRTWSGGVASIEPAKGHQVVGAVYQISRADCRVLDRCEGVPFAYLRTRRTVSTEGGEKVRAWAYIMARRSPTPPTSRYVTRIAEGYEALGLNPNQLAQAITHALDEGGF